MRYNLVIIFFTFSLNCFADLTPQQQRAFSEAQDLKKNKKYKEAIVLLKQFNQPQQPKILDELADIFEKTNDHLEEIRALELIRATNPMSPAQYVRLGKAYAKIKKKEEAVGNYREALKIAPKFERAYEALYEFYLESGMMPDARNMVIEIVDKFGSSKKWMNEFCRLELDQKYFDTAKNICQEAILNDPKAAENHVYLGLAYRGTGNDEQSRKILTTTAKQFPKSELAQLEAGKSSIQSQNWELAKKQLSLCIKYHKKAYGCYFELAKAEYELKSYEVALDYFKKACPYIKDVEVELRKSAFDLGKMKQNQLAQKYSKQIDSCKSAWFANIKKRP